MGALSGQQMIDLGMLGSWRGDAVQPAGVDLRADEVARIASAGALYQSDKTLPETRVVATTYSDVHEQHVWHLRPGAYLVRMGGDVAFPADVVGYLRPRSTLIRIGASLHTGLVDPGYHGRLQCLLMVYNPEGIALARGARICQMSAHRLEQAATETYHGSYQGEGLVVGKPWSVCPECGGPSDLEGNQPCAQCDWGEATRVLERPPRAETLAELDAQATKVQVKVNPRLIVRTFKGIVPSFRRQKDDE